jgi:XRE family transcriptional regulator, aerobic/anaerobic benzoate catabolism transcriptional regulator
MAGSKTKPKSREKDGGLPAAADAFAAAVGGLVRSARAKRGITRRQLAEQSGASERYLAQIESGQGNPSVTILKGIADALDVPVAELLPGAGGRGEAFGRILDLLAGVPPSELSAIADLIEGRTSADLAADRAQRIALVGLRGAGKSTLGRKLAERLGVPFIELDRLIEQEYGTRISDLVEIAGVATFRRYERGCLERVIAEHDAAVIATAGGIVSSPETYGLHGLDQGAAGGAHAPRDGAGRLPPDGAEPRGDGGPDGDPRRAQRRLRARRSRARHLG